jgi:hypothetical protein
MDNIQLIENRMKSYCDNMIEKTKIELKNNIDLVTKRLVKGQDEAIQRMETSINGLEEKTTNNNKYYQQENKRMFDNIIENQAMMMKILTQKNETMSTNDEIQKDSNSNNYFKESHQNKYFNSSETENYHNQCMIPTTNPKRIATPLGHLESRNTPKGIAARRQ